MARVGEHVHGRGAREAEAVRGEAGAVARERGGVAGDVDHAAGAAFGDGVERARVAPLARRVEHDGVHRPVEPYQHVLDLPAKERSVGDAVCGGVLPRVFDRLRHHFDAGDMRRMCGEQQRDRADAAVSVHDVFAGRRAEQPHRFPVEHGDLARVDLQKRLRADGEPQPADALLQRGLAAEQAEFRPEDHVRIRPIDVEINAVHIRKIRQQRVRMRQAFRGCHDHRHRFARIRHARHHMPQHAGARRLFVRGDAIAGRPFLHAAHDIHDAGILNGAVLEGNKPVAARRIEAERRPAVRAAERETALVAVAPRIVHAAHGGDVGRGEPAEPLERIHNDPALERQLRGIVEVLQRTSAAGGVGGAGGAHALRRGGERFERFGHGITGRDLDDMRADALAR